MSIYSSDYEVGLDEEHPTGDVLAYRGSHIFPEPDDVRAAVFLSSIPGHCVPGGPVDDFDHVGGFLRLDVMQNVDMLIDATVVLTVAGATLLRDQLTAWLDRPKREPNRPEGSDHDH